VAQHFLTRYGANSLEYLEIARRATEAWGKEHPVALAIFSSVASVGIGYEVIRIAKENSGLFRPPERGTSADDECIGVLLTIENLIDHFTKQDMIGYSHAI
jgi:hypothetical protein